MNLHGVNVLSVFDGMSCAQIALERAGIKVNNYFSAEIDKYAMKVTMAHYPQTVQLGTIENWKSWDLPKIDLFIGGSPCQGFSNAGLGLNFDDPRSKLFFTYVDILKDLREKNPDLQFLLENVKMKKEWQKIITEFMGVEPVLINSALVSAQNRQRLYWANWKIEQPEDKHIYLKDIIEEEVEDKYLGGYNPTYKTQSNSAHDEEQLNVRKDEKSNCVVPSYPHRLNGMIRVGDLYPSGGIAGRIYSPEGKSPSLRTATGGNHMPKISTTKTRYVATGKVFEGESLKSNTVKESFRSKDNFSIEDNFTYRKLTPIECERLQTVEPNWTDMLSNTQRYKCLGNGWTIDVIAHILNSNPNLR